MVSTACAWCRCIARCVDCAMASATSTPCRQHSPAGMPAGHPRTQGANGSVGWPPSRRSTACGAHRPPVTSGCYRRHIFHSHIFTVRTLERTCAGIQCPLCIPRSDLTPSCFAPVSTRIWRCTVCRSVPAQPARRQYTASGRQASPDTVRRSGCRSGLEF